MLYDLRFKKRNPNAGKCIPATDFTRQVKVAYESVPLVQAPTRQGQAGQVEASRKEH